MTVLIEGEWDTQCPLGYVWSILPFLVRHDLPRKTWLASSLENVHFYLQLYRASGCEILIVSWRSFPPKFPVKSADFSKNLPRKSFEIWLFSAKILRNRPIFLRILTFLPWKSLELGRFLSEFWLFSREIGRFFREFAQKNPAKFCFFPRSIRSPDFNTNLQLSSYSLLHNC